MSDAIASLPVRNGDFQPNRSVKRQKVDRIDWVDLARGVGIILVVFGHSWRGLQEANLIQNQALFERIDTAIYTFHMPLFFFLSGLFFSATIRRSGVVGSLKTRIRTLIYPLVLWTYVILSVQWIVSGSINSDVSFNNLFAPPLPPQSLFWFLWALFLIQCVASIFVAAPLATHYRAAIGVSLLLLSYIGFVLIPPTDAWVRPALEHFPYFFLGIAAGGIRGHSSSNVSAALALTIFALVIALAPRFVTTEAAALVAASLCIGSLMTCFIWLDATLGDFKALSWLRFIGRVSMAIYLAHVIFTAGARVMLISIGNEWLSIHIIIGTTIGIIGPVLLFILARALGLRRFFGF